MTRPVPSTNLPNLIALVAAKTVEDVKKNKATSNLELRMGPPEIWQVRARLVSGTVTVKQLFRSVTRERRRYWLTQLPVTVRASKLVTFPVSQCEHAKAVQVIAHASNPNPIQLVRFAAT
jgi:hypothetical protein